MNSFIRIQLILLAICVISGLLGPKNRLKQKPTPPYRHLHYDYKDTL